MRVLLIDDSEIALALAGNALRGAGLDVVTLLSPVGGATALVAHKPDIVVIDMDMPALPGEKAAHILKRQRFLADLKVLLYSSRSAADLVSAARRSGADGWVQKDADCRRLVDEVLRHLES